MKFTAVGSLFGVDHSFETLALGPIFGISIGDLVLDCSADKILAQIRCPGKRQPKRGKQRNTHSDRERAEEGSIDSMNSNEREENNNRRDGRANERRSH